MVTPSDDVSDFQLTANPMLSSESRDSSDVIYHAVLGLMLCVCTLLVAVLVVYMCSLVCRHRHAAYYRRPVPADDVTPTAVTSVNSSARANDVDDAEIKTGLLKSLLGTASTVGGDESVTWYGSRDVEAVSYTHLTLPTKRIV